MKTDVIERELTDEEKAARELLERLMSQRAFICQCPRCGILVEIVPNRPGEVLQ